MRITRKLILTGIGMLCTAGMALAQSPPPMGSPMGSPPPGGPPPADPKVAEQVFGMIDANKNGFAEYEEIALWARAAMAPGPNGEAAGLLLLQSPMPAPPGVPAPPAPDPNAVKQVFGMIDKSADGKLQIDEIEPWVKDAMLAGPHGEPPGLNLWEPGKQPPGPPPGGPGTGTGVVPGTAMPPPAGGPPPTGAPPAGGPPPTGMPMGTPPPPPPGEIPEPPPCSEALKTSEQSPQKTNVPCNGKEGNLLFRTVCNSDGFDQQAITLPAGRAAGCFGVEAITHNKVVFGIRVEGGADVYHSSAGPAALTALVILDTAPSATGKYTIYLDRAASDPGARVTVRFVDYPK